MGWLSQRIHYRIANVFRLQGVGGRLVEKRRIDHAGFNQRDADAFDLRILGSGFAMIESA